MYANVAVDFADADRTRTYTYAVPHDQATRAGDLVWVPFGHRPIQGIVMDLAEESTVPNPRPITSAVEGGPFLSSSQIELARWITDYCRTGLFKSAELMLPPGTTARLRIWVSRTSREFPDASSLDALRLTDDQFAVLNEVPERGRIRRDKLSRSATSPRNRIIESLLRDGYLHAESLWDTPTGKPRVVKHIRIRDAAELPAILERYRKRNANRRAELIETLTRRGGSMLRAQASREFGGQIVRAVIDDGAVEEVQMQQERDPLADFATQDEVVHDLTAGQASCVDEIARSIRTTNARIDVPRCFLLHGVTGSGKTEVYLRAVRECIASGKRAIVMVPEIAMTPQMLQRFASRFPGQIALQHSGLTPGQRYDQWHQINAGRYAVVLGSRSSIFAPVGDLGLVVIDEEHEWTFKQSDRAPRYHARDVAERLCEINNATLVVGSATPDVSTYHRSVVGETSVVRPYRRLDLPERVHQQLRDGPASGQHVVNGKSAAAEALADAQVDVSIVDMRMEFASGHREMLSRKLLEALRENVDAGRKAILFINRRGSASFVQCVSCGTLRKCPNCTTTLALHRASRVRSGSRLHCHYCSYSVGADRQCKNCGARGIGRRAAGTEGAEESVKAFFPNTAVIRWDSDTARNAKDHSRILEQFQADEPQILVGTQMVAKGLDIPTVGLVGVLSADTSLAIPSYRSPERTFQLIAQVVGRAGRAGNPGRAVVQTFMPESLSIARAAVQDYAGFYESEIAVRRNSDLPPFVRHAKLSYANFSEDEARAAATSVATRLQEWIDSQAEPTFTLYGPTPAFPYKRSGKFRYNIFISLPNIPDASFNPLLDAVPLAPPWNVEIDPLDMS